MKAIYYLIEKRLKQGLNFPDSDYNALIENTPATTKQTNYKMLTNEAKTNYSTHSAHTNTSNTNISQTPNLSSNNVIVSTNGSTGIVKQNSQLLPKRHNVQLATRSSSQKNVDFKSIFTNMNLNNNRQKDNDSVNNNDSNSPSPDFIAAAVNPIRNNTQINSASSTKNSRQTNYADINRKQVGSNSSISNVNSSNVNINGNKHENGRTSVTSYGGSQTDYKVDRYFVPTGLNRASPIEEPYQAPVYYQPENRNISSNLSNNNNNVKLGTTGSIRSLPSSIYRGSPERTLPKSPDRYNDYLNNNNANYYRPTTSRVSSRPSISDHSEKSYDLNHKYKLGNYLSTKRSLTSYDEPTLERQKTNASITSNIIKNRQLHMGKAKIELDTQPSKLKYFVN